MVPCDSVSLPRKLENNDTLDFKKMVLEIMLVKVWSSQHWM